jgi:predicted DNA-binding protein (MmcQ/YjbR family)
MDNERIRAICFSLPHVAETVNWGHHLVYWVGDREIGGKMFAMTDLDGTGYGKLLFHTGEERFHDFLEHEGIVASPYLAKAKWVTLLEWDSLPPREIEQALAAAHALTYAKLPPRTQKILALPDPERKQIIRAAKAKAAAKLKAEEAALGRKKQVFGAKKSAAKNIAVKKIAAKKSSKSPTKKQKSATPFRKK